MPVTNGKITAPFNTWTVSRAIGMGSVGDVSTIIQKALVGGGLAFDSNGDIIQGKKPYWNVFSNLSPGVWRKTTLSSNEIVFMLRDYNPKGIGFPYWNDLSSFEGYNHNEYPPIFTARMWYTPALNRTKVTCYFDAGGFNWSQLTTLTGGFIAPIRFGVHIKAFGISEYMTFNEIYNYDTGQTAFAKDIDINGKIQQADLTVYVHEGTNIDDGNLHTLFSPKTFTLANGNFFKTIQAEMPASLDIILEAEYSVNGQFNRAHLVLEVQNGVFPKDVTLKGRVVGRLNGVGSPVIRFQGSTNVTAIIRAGQTSPELGIPAFNGQVEWSLVGPTDTVSITLEIESINLQTGEYLVHEAIVRRP